MIIVSFEQEKGKNTDTVRRQKPIYMYQQKIIKTQICNTKTPQKISITQLLGTVGVTSAISTGVVKPVYGYLTFPLTI